MKVTSKIALALFCLSFTALDAGHAVGDDTDTSELEMGLASVLAGEESCGFHYNQDAIQTFIIKHAPAGDMDFGDAVDTLSKGDAEQYRSMDLSRRTAFCAQTAQVAKNYGFLK